MGCLYVSSCAHFLLLKEVRCSSCVCYNYVGYGIGGVYVRFIFCLHDMLTLLLNCVNLGLGVTISSLVNLSCIQDE